MNATGVSQNMSARGYYTRRVLSIWWVSGPLLGILLVCASLGAMVSLSYADSIDRSRPTKFYAGVASDVTVPIWATRVNLWAEFATTAQDAADTADLHAYVGLASAFVGTRADGSPWVFEPTGQLRPYVRNEGEHIIVGVPVGASFDRGEHAAMVAEVAPVGYALGFEDESVINALPFVFLLPAAVGVVMFLMTMTPRRNSFEAAIETTRQANRKEAQHSKLEQSREMDARARANERLHYQRQMAQWRGRNHLALSRGEIMDGAPTDPTASEGMGPLAVLMIIVVFAGPLWGLVVGATTGIQALGSDIAGNSVLTVIMPLMGDTPWRVFVMATTALLIVGLPPALAAMLAWRVHLPWVRSFALIATGVLLVAMLVLTVVGTNLPIDRAIR